MAVSKNRLKTKMFQKKKSETYLSLKIPLDTSMNIPSGNKNRVLNLNLPNVTN